MNILILPDVGRSYNAVRPEAEIYIGLANAGHQITIMTDLSGEYVSRYQSANIELIELIPDKKVAWHSIKKIRTVIHSKKIDVVYASKSRTIPNAAFACIGTRAKMVAYRGTTGGLYKTDLSNYLSILHPRINGVICVSNAVKNHVKSKVRHEIKKQVTTIYKGHDLSWYMTPPVQLDSLGINKPSFNVLCIGSPRAHKGMQYVLDAAKNLNDIEDLNIILVGNHFDCEPYISQIKQTGMADRIIQPGFRNDVPQIAAACDVMVLPSIREGLPRSILESLASGTPVITSANEGAMEIIEEGVNGHIVPLRDGKAIAEKVRFLYEHRNHLKKLSNNAQHTIQSKMSHQETVKNYIEYFNQLINQH
ncbi:glycosyltransferase family 4 protein [Aliikangiella sp. IMCC44359]|uniref:glycosyltransferase family 4 protein n=1 Tax=Aliikangiella sp. IMCC44359 TaxID=3459125 RepID=UPI00403AEFDB